LEDTPLAGARFTGRLGQLAAEAGRIAVTAYEEDVDFYDSAAEATREAFEAQDRENAGTTDEFTRALFFSDLHCNIGMTRVMGAAARGSHAQLVLDGGDTTMDGTAVERYCVDAVADALPKDVPWVVSPGNHDTAATAEQERRAGAVVLDGSVVRVAGLAILGDADPTHTEVASGTSLVGEETGQDVARRLSRTACEASRPVDLLLVHDPWIAATALKDGCVPAAVSGHMHTRTDPHPVGEAMAYTASSTGRDTAETTTFGPLAASAEITILYFDPDGAWAAWQLLTVNPDASASLGQVEYLPWAFNEED
jgi:hypothetical protein